MQKENLVTTEGKPEVAHDNRGGAGKCRDEAQPERKPGGGRHRQAVSAAEAEREKSRRSRDNFLGVARFPDNFLTTSAAGPPSASA